MIWTLAQLAQRVRQTVPCEVRGDADVILRSVRHPAADGLATALVPCFDAGTVATAAGSGAGALLLPADLPAPDGIPALVAQRPRVVLGLALAAFDGSRPAPGIDPTARVSADASVDPTATVGPFVVIEAGASVGPRCRLDAHVVLGGGVTLGADCRIGAATVVTGGTRVGRGVIIQPHAVIGADGFSYDTASPSNVDVARGQAAASALQPWIRIPSVGTVVIGDGVEIGAGACIDRPTLGVTTVGSGTKIDNLVQIAHHVQIGEHCLLAAQAGVAGSCVIEDGAVLGGQAGIVDHKRVGRLAVVLGGADVHSDIPPGEVVAGAPARPRREWFKRLAAAGRLERVRTRLRSIEERITALEESR